VETDERELFRVASGPDVVEQLHAETVPIPGRPGWRRDPEGRKWYSAAWLGEGARALPGAAGGLACTPAIP
jgi:hypothetical protein